MRAALLLAAGAAAWGWGWGYVVLQEKREVQRRVDELDKFRWVHEEACRTIGGYRGFVGNIIRKKGEYEGLTSEMVAYGYMQRGDLVWDRVDRNGCDVK